MSEESENVAGRRIVRERVRTGCVVCKIRRVKCDEAKPSCVRCTSTGRKCEYAEPAPTIRGRSTLSSTYSTSSQPLSLYHPSPDVLENASEYRSFQYLRSRVLQDISGCFELGFWDNFVLQVSYAEASVRHALLALSSLYEVYDSDGEGRLDFGGNQPSNRLGFALQEYTKAVGLLASNISTERPSFQAVLISCLIFVWIEFVQSNIDIALHHLRSGLKIMKDLQQSSRMQEIDASLPRMFRRLHTQARLHGSPSSDFNSDVSEPTFDTGHTIPGAFSSIFEARECLDAESDSIYQTVRQMYDPGFVKENFERHPYPDPLSLEALRQFHLQNLHSWYQAYQNTPSLSRRPADAIQSAGVQLLELQYTMTCLWLKTLLETSEMIFDTLTADFERIISLAGRLLHNALSRGGLRLSFDVGVIGPLAMVALKCRRPETRRRAIALLKLAPEREGMFHRDIALQYVEWKMEMEERGFEMVLETTPLPESARIYGERLREATVDGERVTIVRFKRGPVDRCGERDFEEAVTRLNASIGEVL